MYELLLVGTILIDLSADFIDRRSTRGSDPYTLTLWTGIVQSLLIFPVIGLVGAVPITQLVLLAVVAFIASYGRMQWYSVIGDHHEDLSRIAPFRRLSNVFVLLMAVLLLGERLSFVQGSGAAMVIAGAMLVTLDRPWTSVRKIVENNRAARLVLVFSFSSACITVLYKYLLTAGVSIWTCYFYMRLFQLMFLLLTGVRRGRLSLVHTKIAHLRLFVFCRGMQAASTFLYLVVIKHIPLTTAQPIAAISPFFVLGAEWLLDRRSRRSPDAAAPLALAPARLQMLRVAAFVIVSVGIVLLEMR